MPSALRAPAQVSSTLAIIIIMTTTQYRSLLIASLLVGILGGGMDLAFPALLPEGFHQAQELHDAGIPTPRLILVFGLGIVALVLYVACLYGLYRFRSWAPRLSVVGTVVAMAIFPLSGAFAQSGAAISASYLASYLWGAALVLAYVPPISAKFRRHDG